MTPALILVAALLQAGTPTAEATNPNRYPFGVGERFEFSAKLGILTIGNASMQVASVDIVRGTPAFRFRFEMEGGNRLFRLNNVNESWTSVANLVSMRFHQEQNENKRHRTRQFEIYADSGFYRQAGVAGSKPTPAHPVDDAAIVYYLRTFDLDVGKTYGFDNYFKAEKNPLVVRVHQSEMMDLPDGSKVRCIVLQPIIGDDGLFSNRSEARIWITDDERRIPVQIRSRFPWGTITLRLENMTLAPTRGL